MSLHYTTDTECEWEDDFSGDEWEDDDHLYRDDNEWNPMIDDDPDIEYIPSGIKIHTAITYSVCDDCGKLQYMTGSVVKKQDAYHNILSPVWYDMTDLCMCLPF